MQYKKREIYDKILLAGRDEFLANGYRGGNIATVALNSKVPIGNLYRYFDGKNGLLEAIVGPTYELVPREIIQLSRNKDLETMPIENVVPLITNKLLKMFDACTAEILILLDKAAGTMFQDFHKKVVDLVDDLFCKKFYPDPTEEQYFMSNLLAKGFINAIFDILRKQLPREKTEEMIAKIIMFFFYEVEKRI